MSGTMRAATFPSKGANIELVNVPIPKPGHGQVRVKVHACGICHSDLFTKYGVFGNTYPRIPGHEAAGVVESLGEGATQFKVGDRVGLGWFGDACRSCRNCREDELVHCEKGKVSGISYDGGYAEYLVAPEIALARLPADISFEDAGPLMCAGVTVFNGMRNQNVQAGELVAVSGVGGLGHLAVQFAAKMGYKVAALSTGDDKAQLAKDLGAHHYINVSKQDGAAELQKLGGAKMIVCTAPHAKTIEGLVKGLAVHGKLLIIAVPQEPIQVSAGELVHLGASLHGWAAGDNRDSEDTLAFALQTGVRAKIETFPLEKVQEALDRMEQNKARFRCVLKIA